MLEDLFKNNKLEYTYIKTYADQNIIKSIIISSNIKNLRYLCIDNSDL